MLLTFFVFLDDSTIRFIRQELDRCDQTRLQSAHNKRVIIKDLRNLIKLLNKNPNNKIKKKKRLFVSLVFKINYINYLDPIKIISILLIIQ